jgi:3-phosphoglycerate kinase
LHARYQKGRRFASLIWCYNISKRRFRAIDWENLNLVKDISGPNAMRNVTVLTTNWNKGAEVEANAANPQTLAAAGSPLERYKNAEYHLKLLCDEEVKFLRFGTFSNPAAQKAILGGSSVGDPLSLIRSLLENKEEVLQVQQQACETRKLAGTTAGKRLREMLERAIQRAEKEVGGLVDEHLCEHDAEQDTIQEDKEDAEEDISRWRGTLKELDLLNSAFLS